MWRVIVAVTVLTGCDAVFGVDTPSLDARTDASIDASVPDGGCAAMTNHDEDGDQLVDTCDSCPTITSTSADADNDGLGDACDPNLSTSADGDKILRTSLFASTAELATDYDSSGFAVVTIGGDEVTIPGGGQIALKTPILPTQMVFEVTAFTGAINSDGIELGSNGAVCTIRATGCGGEPNQVCVAFTDPVVSFPVAASSIHRIALFQKGTDLNCEITAATTHTVSRTGAFQSSVPFVRTLGMTALKLSSVLFYGEK